MESSEAVNKISTRDRVTSGQSTLIVLDGALDLESSERLDREFADATWMGNGEVTLDMSGLQLIDEPAIAAVLRGIDTLRATGAELVIHYPSPMALQLFELCAPMQMIGIEFTF